MSVIRVQFDTDLWDKLIVYLQNCSWEAAGKHLAEMMKERRFTDWEAVFAAIEDERIIGFCTFLKTDYYPENRYSPWISSIFVDEQHRGHRISHEMIEAAVQYAREIGFKTVYIPSDMTGFYEKCGFTKIDELKNYAGEFDSIFSKEI
ncbi:MAG: GNAT family N-acetyltransferase [Ruminococcus sp.]|nr:GNAT family N-acetyltransferase [Ruminococcus sp.]